MAGKRREDMAFIEFDKVGFSYDGSHRALDGVDLCIGQGEFVCVVGGNGSGKSTLIRHMNGLLVPNSGEVRVGGRTTRDAASTFQIRSSIGMVFQNPDDQLVASIVEDDVAFGPENLGVEPAEIRARVSAALAQVGLDGFERTPVDELSGGQKQRVAIAGALAMRPQALVLDEASAMLDPQGRVELMDICRTLNDQGTTIVMVTHFMDEAAQAQRVVALQRGQVVLDGAPADVLAREDVLRSLGLDVPFAVRMGNALRSCGVKLADAITEDDLVALLRDRIPQGAFTKPSWGEDAARHTQPKASEMPEHPHAASSTPRGTEAEADESPVPTRADGSVANPILRFENVSFSYAGSATGARKKSRFFKRRKEGAASGKAARTAEGQSAEEGNLPWALESVSFDLCEGELLGIAGHTGSGKSTLAQLCNGLRAPTKGRVMIGGLDTSDSSAARHAHQAVGLVFQYPEHQLFASTVYEDVAFGPRNLGVSPQETEERVAQALEAVGLSLEELRDTSPFALSGGQQRRVAFAGVLAMRPPALVFDEPTAGLDPRSREAFLRLIGDLRKREGKTVAVISHDMDALAQLCDRVLVLHQGRLCTLGSPAEVFADAASIGRIGLEAPATMRLVQALGLPKPTQVPSPEELAAQIARLAGAYSKS